MLLQEVASVLLNNYLELFVQIKCWRAADILNIYINIIARNP